MLLSFPRDHPGHLGHLDSQAIQEKRSGTPLASFSPAFNNHCGLIVKHIDVSLHSFHIRHVSQFFVFVCQGELGLPGPAGVDGEKVWFKQAL